MVAAKRSSQEHHFDSGYRGRESDQACRVSRPLLPQSSLENFESVTLCLSLPLPHRGVMREGRNRGAALSFLEKGLGENVMERICWLIYDGGLLACNFLFLWWFLFFLVHTCSAPSRGRFDSTAVYAWHISLQTSGFYAGHKLMQYWIDHCRAQDTWGTDAHHPLEKSELTQCSL